MRNVILLVFLFLGAAGAGKLDRIKRAFEKGEFEKANELIAKAHEKDPENAGVHYYSALLYSNPSLQLFDLDSARIILKSASKYYEERSEEEKEDLNDDGVTRETLNVLHEDIRDRIYLDINRQVSIEGVERFMQLYPASPYDERLVFQRDSLVYEQVKRNDALGVYQRFLDKYNTTEFRELAMERIDELRYQVLTHSGTLSDYYQFLDKHGNTKFRTEIEAYIFRVSNRAHTAIDYKDFIAFATNKSLKKKAADILHYLSKSSSIAFDHPNQDSMRSVNVTASLKLLPAMEQGKFGFHSSTGELEIPYQFSDVAYDYKCRFTSDEWLFVSTPNKNQVINRLGKVLVEDIEAYEDLGFGAALVRRTSGTSLYHKSGFKILEQPIEDAAVLNGRWIKVRKGGKWGLVSYSGFSITDFVFDDVRIEGNFWIFEKEELLGVFTEAHIERDLKRDGSGLEVEFKFEDLEFVSDEVVIGFRDDRECMLDDKLNFMIPWGAYEINPAASGWYLKTPEGYRLYNHSEQDLMNQVHPYLETNKGWLAINTSDDWMLLSRKGALPTRGYDSLKLINEHAAWTSKAGDQNLMFSNGAQLPLLERLVKTFFDQPNYLLIEEEDIKLIIDQDGNRLLEGAFDEITFFNDTLLKVEVKGKQGLLQLDGNYLLRPEYDALDEEDGLVLCLQGGKIGAYDLKRHIQISATSESRIERIGFDYLLKKDGKFGLVDSVEMLRLSHSYDEVKYWNDSSFLVRNDIEWNFINALEEPQTEPIELLVPLVGDRDQSIWKFVKDGKYGLLSNQNGILLENEFTDIFNIGSKEEPIFFADQHLNKAGYHVVSYVNAAGELLLSKAYTLSEFDRLLCDD